MSIIVKDELKAWLGIPDTVDDPLITIATNAANQFVTEYCGRTFDKTATGSASARVFQPTEGCGIWVDDFWETSVLAVKVDRGDDGTYEETWTLNTDYTLEPLNGQLHGQTRPYYRIVPTLGQSLPVGNRRPAVQVTAAWGWATVPDGVKHATLLQGSRLFYRKDSPAGVIGGAADFTALRVSRLIDPDVADELEPFRHPKAGSAPQVA